MRRCLAPQLNLAVTPEKRGAWLANREALVDGVRLDQNFAWPSKKASVIVRLRVAEKPTAWSTSSGALTYTLDILFTQHVDSALRVHPPPDFLASRLMPR